jgi:hypothetical protein
MAGLLDFLSGGADANQTQGLLAAAAQMLQQSGPSRTPTSIGQIVGGGINAYQGATQQAQQLQQQQQLRDLQIKSAQSELDDQDLARQRSAGLQSLLRNFGQGQGAGAAPTTPAPMFAGGQSAASMMQGLATGAAPDAGMPAAPAPASAPAAAPGAGFDRNSLVQQHLQLAQALRQGGYEKEAEAHEDAAVKLQPKYATDFRVAMGADGKLHNYQLADDGTFKDAAVGVRPEVTEVDLGGTKAFVDKNAVTPGQVFKKTLSPDAAASNALGYARLNFDKSQATAGPDVDPKQVDNVAQLISAGRMAPLGSMAMRSPFGAAVMSRVAELNPDYNGIDYGTNAKASRDFATGKQGNAVRSFNVSLSHLDTLGQLADAMNNGNMQAINKLGNAYSQQTGSAAPTNFEAAKKIVTDEIVKAITGGGGGVHDREAAAATIGAANSPAQLKGAIKTYQDLMVGQLGGLEQQYRTTTGRSDFNKYLSPQAQTMFHTTGGAPAVTGAAPAQQAAPAASKAATLSDIAATARASGRSTAEVTAALRAKGYTITGG